MLIRLTVCLVLCCWFADAAGCRAQDSPQLPVSPILMQSENALGHSIRQATTEEIEQAIQNQNYQPVLKNQLIKSVQDANNDSSAVSGNDIINATYEATLTSGNELNGEIRLSFSNEKKRVRQLGPTNLQNLKFLNSKKELTLGKTSDETAVLLVPADTQNVEGYWISRAQQQNGTAVFDLQLPIAVISKFKLTTAQDVLVTSPNSLVQSSDGASDDERSQKLWTLYPSRSGRLTINCSNRSSSFGSTDRIISSQADYQIQSDGCQARWNLNLPGLPIRSEVEFRFSRAFTPQSIIGGGQAALPFAWNAEENALTIRNSTETSLSAIVISGEFAAPESNACPIPVLNGGSWKETANANPGQLRLSSAALRVGFPSDLTVQSSTLLGLMETDVEFTADGSQRLVLEQFAEPATAEFQLLLPVPVLQDEVVTRTTEEPGQIETLIRIENRSGVADTIRYEVPGKYRVTAVRELDTQLPLLFRIAPSDSLSATQPVEIFFRSPLPRASRQLLQIRLQSTANEVNLEETLLRNPAYLRLTDVIVLNSTRLPPGLRETQSRSYAEFRTQHPWVPAVEDAIVIDRSQLPKTVTTADEKFVVTAAIDHSLMVADDAIRESIQIRFTAAPALPSEIILQAADSGNLKLKPLDQQLGYSLQRRISGRSPNEWVLGLPSKESQNTATVTVECERPATGRHIPMLLSMPSITVRTADIRLVEPSAIWSLIDGNGQPVTDAASYPDRPLETSLRIQVRKTRDRSQQVHGTATWLLDQAPNAIRASVLVQLSVFGISDRISLDVDELTSKRIRCLVNGHRMVVQIQNGRLDILLPQDGSDSQIQILIQDVWIEVDKAASFQIPSIQLKDSSLRGIDTIVAPPTGRTVAAVSTTALIRIGKGTAGEPAALPQTPSNDIQHFLARLAFRQDRVESLFLSIAPGTEIPRLILGQIQARLVTSIVTASFLIILLTVLIPDGPIAWVVTGFGILLAQGIGIVLPDLAPGPSIMTAAIAAAGAIIYFKERFQRTHKRSSQLSLPGGKSVAIGLGVLLTGTQISQAQLRDDILIPGPNSPIVFVPPELVPLLQSAMEIPTESPVFLDSQVVIDLLARDSLSATVTCHIAVDSATDQHIALPVGDVTLIKCALNGSSTLPMKFGSSGPSIAIPAIPQPAARLAANAPVVATPMKEWVAGLKVYELSYTVRMVARPDFPGAKAVLPLPPTPVTEITIKDQTGSITEARLLTPEPTSGVRLGSEFNYPIFSNLSRVEIQLQFAKAGIDAERSPQESEVIARILAVPNGLKFDCNYEVRPIDARSETVRLPRLSQMNLIRAKAEDGTVITPSIEDNFVEIPVSIDRQGLQKFKLAWQMPLAFAQQVPINTQELRQVNGIPADRLVLAASTSDRFTISSVSTNQALLDPIPESQRPPKLALRQNELAYSIPATVDSITLQLASLFETREAGITQTAIVERNQINWKCECELQIPDEPIFRQSLTVSSDLKVQSISVRSGEIDRLQSWYRNGDALVVCLREATRGSLTITIDGILPRQPQKDTSLPVVTLPKPVDVLEFSLELSAADPESVFIRSLAGTTPDSQFRTEAIAVPTSPIRFTVTDETSPLIIRAEPQKAARATVVVLLSEQNDQTQISIFMALKAVESPFNLQFSRPSNVAYATSNVLLLPAEGSLISSAAIRQAIDVTAEGSIADNNVSAVALTGIVPAMTSSILSVPLPVFDAPCEFESFQVLDGRDQNGVTAVPRWIRNILPELPNATSPGNTNPLPVTISQTRDQMRIQLPLTTPAQDKASDANVPAFAISTHNIEGDEFSIRGTFSTLAFSPAANATLTIALPAAAKLMQMRIDGKPAPFKFDGEGQVLVTLVDRTCLVEMDWFQSVPQNNMLRSSQVKLPILSNVEGSVFINRKLPGVGWRPRSVTADSVKIADLLTEITSGLQIIGTGPVASSTRPSERDPSQENPLSDAPAWAELQSQSAETAKAYIQLISKLQGNQPDLLLAKLDSPNPIIEIRQQFPASSLMIILAAVSMLIAGLTTRSTTKSAITVANTSITLADAEGSTEIHRATQP